MNREAHIASGAAFSSRTADSVVRARRSCAVPALIVSFALLVTAGVCHGAPTAYEPFNYAVGGFPSGTASTGIGFSGSWTCGIPGSVVSGLTYAGVPAGHNALQSAGARQFVRLASPLAGGTRWMGFLFKTSAGNPGGNINGVFLPNDQANCLWFGFGLAPFNSTQGQLGLGSMITTGTTARSATSLVTLGLGTYGATYLVVLKIEFNTSGNQDTVTVYLNPVANQATPGVAAAGTYSAFDVGAISGVGLNVTGAGEIIVDEIRFGDTYADVVGAVIVPPAAPTGLNATPGTNRVSLSWSAATGSPTGYHVKRSTDAGGPYTNVIGVTTVPTVTYVDPVLGGQPYYYVVSAVNGAGESADTPYVSAVPILGAPATPAGLSATAGDAQVSLSWTASDFATSYTVKRATDLAGPYGVLGTTSAPTVSYVDAGGLANGTTYYYVVSATGAGGPSLDSAPVSATPFGPMPLVAGMERGVGIRWFAVSGVTYQVQWASEDLGTNTVWDSLGGAITGDGTTNTVFDPVGPPHNYYQVISIE